MHTPPEANLEQRSHVGSSTLQAKVPIPRLAPPREHSAAINRQRDRATRACRNCHKRKIKCSGGLPRCSYCERSNKKCVYDASRRDKLAVATSRNERLTSLLRDLSGRMNDDDRSMIQHILQGSEDEGCSPAPTHTEDSVRSTSYQPIDKQERESQTPTFMNFLPEPLESTSTSHSNSWSHPSDIISHNSYTDSSHESLENRLETEFADKTSSVDTCIREIAPTGQIFETKWLLDLKLRVRDENSSIPATTALFDCDYFVDNKGIHLVNPGNPFSLPDERTARTLFQCYSKTVQRAFPMVSMGLDRQLMLYYHSLRNQQSINFPPGWYATVNLILAIGARYSRIINAEWSRGNFNEAIYVSRAYQLLGFNETAIVLAEPDYVLTQAAGLLAFYYMSTGHVNRAWVMISTSLRFALALKLNLYDPRTAVDAQKKRAISATWWSLHNLESLLCTLTGRPCMLRNEDITTPLPHQMAAERGEQGTIDAPVMLFQDAQVRLAIFSAQIQSQLYTERREELSWAEKHGTMVTLMTNLDTWASKAMPPHLQTADTMPGLDRLQLLLRKHYCRLKLLIARPSLERIEHCFAAGTREFSAFDRTTAEICIQTADDVVNLLPDKVDLRSLYERGPWWTIVHNFMQSATILLIAISLRDIFPASLAPSINSFHKLVNWLRAMREGNDVAERAFTVLHDVVGSARKDVWPEVLHAFHQEGASVQDSGMTAMAAMKPMYLPWQT